MDLDQKVDDIHGMVHEMKPMISTLLDGQKGIEERLRLSELRSERHDVQIVGLKSDLDSLGQKIREKRDDDNLKKYSSNAPSSLRSIADILNSIPKYWHIIVSVAIIIIGAFGLIFHPPRGSSNGDTVVRTLHP